MDPPFPYTELPADSVNWPPTDDTLFDKVDPGFRVKDVPSSVEEEPVKSSKLPEVPEGASPVLTKKAPDEAVPTSGAEPATNAMFPEIPDVDVEFEAGTVSNDTAPLVRLVRELTKPPCIKT